MVRLNASTAYTVGAASSATVKVVSDDKPSVAIGASASTATEGGAAGQFTRAPDGQHCGGAHRELHGGRHGHRGQ